MRGMDAQQRHVFADSIRKLAQDKDRTEDLIKRISLIVGRAFVENLLAVFGRQLDPGSTDVRGDYPGGGSDYTDAGFSRFVLPLWSDPSLLITLVYISRWRMTAGSIGRQSSENRSLHQFVSLDGQCDISLICL